MPSSSMILFRRHFHTTTLESEGKESKVWSVAFDPLGKYLLVGTDSSILVLDAQSGELIRTVNGHEGNVYCVAYSPDGLSFASGGSDKNVMLWKRNCDGILRYSHSYPIQYVEYNPVSFELASSTSNDMCLWSMQSNKRIHKCNIAAKCLSMNWSPNGKFIALSLQNNSVLIYDKSGKHLSTLNGDCELSHHHNIVCCQWYDNETLIIGSWNRILSLYSIESGADGGGNRMKVKNIQNTPLDFYPNCICLLKRHSCIILIGLDNYMYLYTSQGTFIEKYDDMRNIQSSNNNNNDDGNRDRDRDCILSICNYEANTTVFYGTNFGHLICNKIIFKTVHSLFENKYCYRADSLCDVYIENIVSKKKLLLKSNGYIKMMAIYKHRMALLFDDYINIYSANPYDLNDDMNYKLVHKVDNTYDCNLLIITTNHLVICTENELQLIDFNGKSVREWKFNPHHIRYIKNLSGAPDQEGILVGLANGEIYTVFIDKKYPILHYKHNGSIRCVDISSSKSKLSIVGEDKRITIYDLNESKVLFQDTNANSVAFNDEFDDMFAFTSNNGIATIRNFNGNFEFTAKTDGFIVRFSASTVYTLFSSNNVMASFTIPQSLPLKKYMQSKSLDNAYKIACLGVTKYEWKRLGLKAIECMRLDIAKKAFTHLSCSQEIAKYTEFVDILEMQYQNQSAANIKSANAADILAFEGEFERAATIYCKHKQYRRAVEMYLDLRDWQHAKELIDKYRGACSYSMNDLFLKEAKWLQSQGDAIGSAERFWAAKQYKTGFDLLFQTGKYDVIKPKILFLLSQQHQNPPQKVQSDAGAAEYENVNEFYEYIASKFKKLNDIAFVKEIYISTKNYAKLIEIYIEREEWDEAFIIINEHKEMKKDILLPYAKWLALNDRFDEASAAFHSAGYPKYAIKILNNLTQNGLIQKKYSDTAYYYWLLAIEHLKFGNIDKFQLFQHKSQLYYAYNIIDKYIESPFTSSTAETLFHSARFALALYDDDSYCDDAENESEKSQNISKVAILYILGKQCFALGAYKLARSILSKLITLRIPSTEWRDRIELDSLLVRTKAFTDPPHLSSYICPRCSTTNYNHNNTQECTHCKHKFMRCMISFTTLPLVEFKIVDSLSHDTALELIQREAPKKEKKLHEAEQNNEENQDINVMRLDDDELHSDDDDDEDHDNDVFYQQLMHFDTENNDKSASIVLDGSALEKITASEIFVIDYRKYCKQITPKYYRCIVPKESYDIILCPNCQFLFRGEEYEVALINNGHLCPFCRYKFSFSE